MNKEKTCSRCHETKPLEKFPKRKDKKSGRGEVCNQCKHLHRKPYVYQRGEKPLHRVIVNFLSWSPEVA